MAAIGGFCPYCGAKVSLGARFCESCGASIEEQDPTHNASKKLIGVPAGMLDLRQVGDIAREYVTKKEKQYVKDSLKITSSKLQSVGSLAVFAVKGTYRKGNVLQQKECGFTLQVNAEDGSVVGEEFYG
jgi:hypothetical protein